MTVRVSPRPALVPQDIEPQRPSVFSRLSKLKLPPAFLIIVVLPVIAAAIYYLFIASPMFVSEARFIVRAPSEVQPTTLGTILPGVKLGGEADDQAYAIHEYVMSRDAIDDLQRHMNLRAMLDRPGADPLERFPRPFEGDSQEALYRAFPRYVSVTHDSGTSISTLKVHLFRPQDARLVASTLLDGGEALVNRLNDRAAHDAVADASRQVMEAEAAVSQAQANLTTFRNRDEIIDPAKTTAADLDVTTRLATELATLQAEREGLAATAPKDPQLPGMDSRIRAFEKQIQVQNTRMAGEAGSLAPKISEYEQLQLQSEFAEKLLASATTSLENAREDARRKRLYLERVVNPDLPDAPSLPHRLPSIALVLVSCLLAYGMIVLISAGLKEHRQS